MTTLNDTYPLYLNNKAEQPNTDLVGDRQIHRRGRLSRRAGRCGDDRRRDRRRGRGGRADGADGELRAPESAPALRRPFHRTQADELAYALCVEAGKPIKDSEGEVGRLIDTFRIAAEESRADDRRGPAARHFAARAKGYQGMWKRVPIGPCSFISPFNFPLNLAAHKIAPALAVGCPFVMKPASRTPLGAIIIGEVLAETDLPAGAFSILPAHRDGADLFTEDDRLKLLSLHRLARCWLGAEGEGRQEEGRARTRRQRGVHRRCRTPISTTRSNG